MRKNFHGYHEPTKTQEKKWLERIALFNRDYGAFPNLTHYPKAYEERFGKQAKQFEFMCEVIRDEDGNLPFPDVVLETILSM